MHCMSYVGYMQQKSSLHDAEMMSVAMAKGVQPTRLLLYHRFRVPH